MDLKLGALLVLWKMSSCMFLCFRNFMEVSSILTTEFLANAACPPLEISDKMLHS